MYTACALCQGEERFGLPVAWVAQDGMMREPGGGRTSGYYGRRRRAE